MAEPRILGATVSVVISTGSNPGVPGTSFSQPITVVEFIPTRFPVMSFQSCLSPVVF